MANTVKSKKQDFFMRHRMVLSLLIGLTVGLAMSYSSLQDIYRNHQVSRAAAATSKHLKSITGGTPDGHTYRLLVPADFKELSEKEAPNSVGYQKRYDSVPFGTIILQAYELTDEALNTLPADLNAAKQDSSDFVKDIKSNNHAFKDAEFDKQFTEISEGRLRINYTDTHYENDDYDVSGSVVLLIKDKYAYYMFVQSRQIYDKNHPDFQEKVIKDFDVY